jgi:hypothetical protein
MHRKAGIAEDGFGHFGSPGVSSPNGENAARSIQF